MKLSLNWLHDYVDVLDIPVAGLINGLTLSTCEVDGVETIYAHLDIVRVARVLKVDKHPDADRLSVCKVQSGKENLTIVCGAPNVRADMLVPLAPVGARLPMGNDEVLEIKKAKIRGVESSGMLCAPSELGLEKITGEVDGLLDLSAWLTDSGHTADETGYALSELFPLADTVLDIDNKSITHRPDLWSHFGFAREIGAIFRRPLKYDPLIGGAPDHHAQGGASGKQSGKKKSAKKVHKKASTNGASSDNSRDTSRHISKATSKASLKATVQKDAATTARVQNDGAASPAVCSHGFSSNSKLPQKQIELEDEAALAYFGRHISGVRVQPSPLWMQARLLAIGQRPINNIVDVSNYVMFETGQPNHAFDARRLQATNIGVAANGSRIKIKNYTTLDGEERAMPDGAILILDGPIQSKTPVVALGGIMGGAGSEVADDTTELFLESATFPRERIRPTISAIGLRTDSAQRFEKGQDPARARPVLDRFTALLALSCPDLQAGKISGRQVVKNRNSKVHLDLSFIHRRLGFAMEVDVIRDILERLHFEVQVNTTGANTRFSVTVPTWRSWYDVTIPEDIIEELGRMHGYDNIEPVAPLVPCMTVHRNREKELEGNVKQRLAVAGFSETYGYSFATAADNRHSDLPPVRLANPVISDRPELRTALLPGLLRQAAANQDRFDRLHFFEFGRIYHQHTGQPRQLKAPRARVARSDTPDQSIFALNALPTPIQESKQIAILVMPSLPAKEKHIPDDSTIFTEFLRLRSTLERTLAGLTGDIQVRDSRDSKSVWYHPGCRVELTCNGTVLGYAGILHPAPAEEYEIRRPALVAEIDFSVLFQAHETGRHQSRYESPSVYPDSLFEVSVILPDDAGTEGPADTILSMQRTEIKEVRFLTVYRGQPLPENQKSASYAIRLGRSDRTLEGDELQNILDAVVAELKQSGYDLR